MTRSISRHSAQKFRLAAQTTAGVVILGSIGLAAMVPGGAPQQRQADDDGPILPTVNNAQNAESDFRLDRQAVADRLAMMDNAPRLEETVVVDPDPPKPGDPVEPVQAQDGLAERVKFLGTMSVGSKKMALISVDNRRQRVVSVGNALPMPADESKVTLREAADDEIIVTDSEGVSIRIRLETPDQKPLVSTLATPTVNDGMAINVEMNGFDRGGDRNSRGRSAPNSASNNEGASASEAIERRRQALQQAVEKGTLTQERADEMMERATQNARQNARQNPGRRED